MFLFSGYSYLPCVAFFFQLQRQIQGSWAAHVDEVVGEHSGHRCNSIVKEGGALFCFVSDLRVNCENDAVKPSKMVYIRGGFRKFI